VCSSDLCSAKKPADYILLMDKASALFMNSFSFIIKHKKPAWFLKSGLMALAGCAFLTICCSTCTTIQIPPYTPVITFSGYLDQAWTELPGYYMHPNTCELHGDSVIMNFYSNDYDPSPIPTGTFLHIAIFPLPRDTIFPISNSIDTHNSMVHCFKTNDRYSCSYDISPADTTGASNGITLTIVSFARAHGRHIEFEKIAAKGTSLTSFCGEPFSILNGVISGTIQ
jgi:hypothetical protein